MSEVEVWRFDLDGDGAAEEPLSALERRRAAAIVRPLARRRWVAARAALRGVLGERLGREPAAVEIHTAPGGKPYLVDADDMRFSLSHSGDVALIALRRGGEVGIDLERVGRRPRAFYEAWVRREALAKCWGTGLGKPPPHRPVELRGLDLGAEWAAALALGRDPRAAAGRR